MTWSLSIQILQGKHELTYTHSIYVQIHDTSMYTHILSKYRARKSFMTRSFLFKTQNKSFHDRGIYLVQ